ncbi:MAG: PAS domain S-box protein [Magnetococcales bacterium]|nr:PAS domain S-box protein [Magnetococcales bacterium]
MRDVWSSLSASGSPFDRRAGRFATRYGPWLTAAIIIGFMTLFAGITLWQDHDHYQAKAATDSRNLVRVLEQNLLRSIREIDFALLAVIDEYRHQWREGGIREAVLNANMALYQQRLPQVISLRITDAEGTVIHGQGVDRSRPVNLADREFFRQARDNEHSGLMIVRPVFARISRQWVIPMVRRISLDDGSFVGIVYVNVALGHLREVFTTLDVGQLGVITLFDGDRHIFTRYPEPKGPGSTIGLQIGSPQIIQYMKEKHPFATYQAQATLDGIRRTFSYLRVGSYPIHVQVGLAEEEYLAGWRKELWFTVFFLGVMSVLVFGALILLGIAWRRQQEMLHELVARDAIRRQLLDELRQSEEKFRTLFNSIGDAVLVHPLQGTDGGLGRFIEANEVACQRLGYTREELTVMTPLDLDETDTHPTADEITAFQESILAEGRVLFERIHVAKDGRRIPVEVSGSIFMLHGEATMLSVVRDISERKQAEAAMRENEQRLREITSTLAEGLYVTDRQGLLTFVNPAALTMVGLAEGDALGKEAHQVFGHAEADGGHCAADNCALFHALEHGVVIHQQDTFFRRRNGPLLPVSMTVAPILRQDVVRGAVVAFHDITERMAFEARQRRDLTRMVGMSRLQSELLAPLPLEARLARITEVAVALVDLDFCRIWLTRPGDPCQDGCPHAMASCRDRARCLHLLASAGRYTHLDGNHRRVPLGGCMIGRIASGGDDHFLTNDVTHDPRVQDHAWARELGLVAFAGYRLTDQQGVPIGVFAMFASRALDDQDDAFLAHLGHVISQVVHGARVEESLERHRADLERQVRFTRAVIDGEVDGVSVCHEIAAPPHVRFTVWNDAMVGLTGYTIEEINRLGWHQAVHADPVLQERARLRMERMRQGDHFAGEEWTITRKDGQQRVVQIHTSPIQADGESGSHVLGVMHDVTGEKRLEREQRDSAAYLHALVEHLPAAIFAKNVNDDFRFVTWNHMSEQMFGLTARQVIGHSDYDFFPVEQADFFRRTDEEVVSRQGVTEIPEEVITTPTRGDRWLHTVKVVVPDSNGQPGILLGISQDITEWKNWERSLAEAKTKAEAANRAKSEFLANMSHEIRTPMNAILGLGQLVLGTELTAKQRDYMVKLQGASKSLLGILNDILDYSKIESGRLELDNHLFQPDDLLEQAVALFMAPAEEKGLELFFRVTPDVPRRLVGDSLRLGQVLGNLLSNAVKFTRQGEIETTVERLASQDEEECLLRFTVRDTGGGVDPGRVDHLFQAFTQADGSISRRYGGTGLGLAISRRLVELMGGKIGIESTSKAGSTFRFTARCRMAPGEAGDSRSATSSGGIWCRSVLVVDDLATSRHVLRETLESWQCQVWEAEDGAGALDVLRTTGEEGRRFDLILLDWKMPGMNGLETAREIRRQTDAGLFVAPRMMIMVTAFDREEVFAGGGETLIDGVLMKPVTPSGLFDTLIDMPSFARFQARQQDAGAWVAMAAPIRGARLLVVEDNLINQQVARELLEQAGLRVQVAANGHLAVAMVEISPFDAVLMDLQMPEMDGFQATERIRLRHPDLPIIAMTASAMIQDRERCLAAGMNDHLAKPIEPACMIDVLLRHIPPGERPAIDPWEGGPSGEESVDLPRHLPGIDLQLALQYVGGNRRLYRRLLDQFRERFQGFDESLRNAAGRTGEVARLAHMLRGVAGTLGARRLQRAAADLEGEAAHPAMLEELRAALAEVLAGVPSPRRPDGGTRGEPVDCGRVGSLLDRLEGIMRRHEVVDQELLEEMTRLLEATAHNDSMAELARFVAQFDYARALVTLASLRAALASVATQG